MTEPNQSSKSVAKRLADDVFAISKRIKAIVDIVQTRGEFYAERSLNVGSLKVTVGESPVETRLTESSRLTVSCGFTFEAVPDDEKVEKRKAIYVQASFVISYDLKPFDEPPSEEAMKAFGEVNGRFNATAYWREFLHSSLGRAGLPRYILPPFDAAARLRRLGESATTITGTDG